MHAPLLPRTPNAGPSHPPTPPSALAPYLHNFELSVSTEVPRSLSLSLLAKQQGLTPGKARQSAQVSGLRKVDEAGVAEALSNLLIFTAQQFNVVRNLTNIQVLLLSQQLLERYWHWRIDEFAYVFHEAVAGTWGKVYDRLDPAIVHEWCTQYETQVQSQLIADASESKAAAFKAAEADTTASEDMPRAYLCQKLRTYTDEELHNNLNECRLRPDAPSAALNKELTKGILAERERAKGAGPTPEQKEIIYQRVKASYIAGEVLKRGTPKALD